jgi:hypothetical protein
LKIKENQSKKKKSQPRQLRNKSNNKRLFPNLKKQKRRGINTKLLKPSTFQLNLNNNK